ncbi:MAG: T9SS type A sorting domain-containing protein, partial [Bacteroidia bacterium]|nr:T9SS type A sorting domain-containing protein [Bacteroidia bacterium]
NDDIKTLTQNQPLDLVAAENSLKEKQTALAKLKVGADPLDIKSQELSLQQKRNALYDAQTALADYTIKAPFDGVIAAINLKVGDSASGVIATIMTEQHIAEISLNEVDVAKIKIPGISHLTGLPSGSSFTILTNDTIQITTSTISAVLIFTTATISGGSSSIRFEVLPAFETQTALPDYKSFNEKAVVVSSNLNELTVTVQTNDFKDLKFQLFSADGKLILQKNLLANTTRINTSLFLKGCYLVKVIQQQKIFCRKVILNSLQG